MEKQIDFHPKKDDERGKEDMYNFMLKGARIDIAQPTKEELQEYEQFKSKN